MSTYNVQVGQTSYPLDGSTPAVVLTTAVAAAVTNASNALGNLAAPLFVPNGQPQPAKFVKQNSDGSFSFWALAGHKYNDLNVVIGSNYLLSATLTLDVGTLDDSLVGMSVLIDPGTGQWAVGTVTGDGSSQAVNGNSLPLTTPAARIVGVAPPLASSATPAGTANSGACYFKVGSDVYEADTLSTIGGLSGAGACFVQTAANAWTVATL